MRDQVLQVIQALHQNRELIADAYAMSGGMEPSEDTAAALSRLIKVKAMAPYIEDTYRLDRRLRFYFDRAINRVKIYGNSTHYSQVVEKIESMTSAFEQAMIKADHAGQDECLEEIVDLCDEFATGIKEDIEHFRMIVDTRRGFSGGALQAKLLHNRTYVEQANEMVKAVGLLSTSNMLEELAPYKTLTSVLRRHLYGRVEGKDNVRRRLFEVQSSLEKLLFDLEAANRLVETILRIDDRLSRNPDFEFPDWDESKLPAATFLWPGLPIPTYIDATREPAESLLPFLGGIQDSKRPQARPPSPDRGTLRDDEEPPPQLPTPSEFRVTLQLLLDDLSDGVPTLSIVDWLRMRADKSDIYPYPLHVWLACFSVAVENGLTAPSGWRYKLIAENLGDRWETPILTDVVIEYAQQA